MNKEAFRDSYETAAALYHAKDYEAACELLDHLHMAAPDDRDLIEARGRCLVKVGRLYEARLEARRLVKLHGEEAAKKLLDALAQHRDNARQIHSPD